MPSSRVTDGDFNDNGYDDIAVGAPGDDSWRGSVAVYYSSISGVSSTDYQYQYLTSVVGKEVGGRALAAGDFDEDGLTDLTCSQLQNFEQAYVLGLEGRPSGLTSAGGFKGLALRTTRNATCSP